MKCTVISYSLSEDPGSLSEWRENLKNEISSQIDNGSKVILYPELFLMGLSQYLSGEELEAVAAFTEKELLPELNSILMGKDVFLVLGSGPRLKDGKIFNSCPIFMDDKWFFQDKLYLTPWETDFTHGNELNVFEYQGLKTAVIVCFDSEQPDLATKLKSVGIDLLLIPSATSNENGSHRVNRCSSARSIELGAAVLTAPLVGDSKSDLIDHNEGRQGFFLPAQEDVSIRQEIYSDYSKDKKVVGHYEIDVIMMKKLKVHNQETKPFHKPPHSSLIVKKI